MVKSRRGILLQVIILFCCGTLVIGAFTYFSLQVMTDSNMKKQTVAHATAMANEMTETIREYPAYKWMIQYWADHWEDMDIEYDVSYGPGTRTEKKARKLTKRHPELQIKYAQTPQIESLPPRDQKLYAEITYSWMINRINQIKQARNVEFLFCVMTEEPYDSQFFLLSAADTGEVRGTKYGQVYTLGVTSRVSETQQMGMRQAKENYIHLVDAGIYFDCYAYSETLGGRDIMFGMTYDMTSLNKQIFHQTWQGTILAMILEIILAWICLGVIFRVVLQPLKTVQENIRLYMRTKDSEEVCHNLAEVDSHNEMGQLSTDVSNLTKEIDDYLERIKTITGEKERINAELSLAARIQSDILPNEFPAFPDRPEFDVYATMTPAREIGGDFYDYFLIDDDHLCLVIADVAGKGIPAAMFMMAARIVLKDNAAGGKSPAKIIEDTNNVICNNNPENMFVTVWLGILEISTGKLTAVNAGHEYPVIKRKDGIFELMKDLHGLMVGGIEGVNYVEYDLQLEEGDILFEYTDGVPEATNARKEMFGIDRMVSALNENADDLTQITENIRNATREFTGDAEQFDDLTMLCLEYKGTKTT